MNKRYTELEKVYTKLNEYMEVINIKRTQIINNEGETTSATMDNNNKILDTIVSELIHPLIKGVGKELSKTAGIEYPAVKLTMTPSPAAVDISLFKGVSDGISNLASDTMLLFGMNTNNGLNSASTTAPTAVSSSSLVQGEKLLERNLNSNSNSNSNSNAIGITKEKNKKSLLMSGTATVTNTKSASTQTNSVTTKPSSTYSSTNANWLSDVWNSFSTTTHTAPAKTNIKTRTAATPALNTKKTINNKISGATITTPSRINKNTNTNTNTKNTNKNDKKPSRDIFSMINYMMRPTATKKPVYK